MTEQRTLSQATVRLGVAVPVATLRALKIRAAQTETTIVAIVNRLIEAELATAAPAMADGTSDRRVQRAHIKTWKKRARKARS